MNRHDPRSILITGASSGLGEGLAIAYAEPGVTLGLVARREDELKRVAERVSALGARALTFPADVTDADRMQEVVTLFHQQAGHLDLVIANAGVSETKGREPIRSKSAGQVVRVNVIGLINTLVPCVPLMVRQGSGTLVGMASVAGYRAMPGSLAYSTSKAAVMTFMEGLSMELEGSGVDALCLCPGFIRTPLTEQNEFSMPFLMELDDACERMKRAITAKKARFTFPLPYALAAQFLRFAPRWVVMRTSPRFRDRKKRMAASD